MLRKAREHKFVCLRKKLSAPGFMGLRPIPALVYLRSCCDSPAACGGNLFKNKMADLILVNRTENLSSDPNFGNS